MEFGKVQRLDHIDFTLPADDPVTEQLWRMLPPAQREPLRVYIGGTEWGRGSWVGRAYPQGTKPKDFLRAYARQFNTVEVNALFYGLQPAAVIERWAASTGEGFRFCPKFPETISHQLRLSGADRDTKEFVERVAHFGVRLGPGFLQLSDRFGPEQAGLLQQYVRQLPAGFRACIELRSEEWFGPPIRAGSEGVRSGGEQADAYGDGGAEQADAYGDGPRGQWGGAIRDVWQQMVEHGVGTVITDVAGRRDVLHMRLTAPVAFIRFVTNSLHPTDYQRADAWVERIKTWAGRGLREVYIFVHSPEELTSPEMMKYLTVRMNERLGLSMPVPNLVNGGQAGNLSLF